MTWRCEGDFVLDERGEIACRAVDAKVAATICEAMNGFMSMHEALVPKVEMQRVAIASYERLKHALAERDAEVTKWRSWNEDSETRKLAAEREVARLRDVLESARRTLLAFFDCERNAVAGELFERIETALAGWGPNTAPNVGPNTGGDR